MPLLYEQVAKRIANILDIVRGTGGERMERRKKFTAQERAGFCSQVTSMLKSGISLEEGMYMLAEEMEDVHTKKILKQVEEKLKQNNSFHSALKESKAFPTYLMNMVHIGETSGKLEDVMQAMTKYYEREDAIQDSIRNVIALPLMMFFMIAIILVALVGKILPMFQSVFANLDVDVAVTSSKLMNLGMWVGRIVAGVSFAVLLVALVLFLWYQTAKGKNALKRFSTKFFATKKTADLLATGRFVSSMSVMISSGMDEQEAMKMAGDVVDHEGIQKKIKSCCEEMGEKSLAEALRQEKIVTGMQGRRIAIADRTGMLEEVFADVSRQYDEKIADQMGRFCTKLETTLVLGLSVVVGGVLLAVMFPLVSIITSIG